MELVELVLTNFKRFADGRFGFCPGLNLLWGPNESGKSTIHEAICCALFGRDRGKAAESWSGGFCAVELTYRCDGKLYRIERGLTDGSSRLGTVVGDELTDVVSGKDEIRETLSGHLGIASRGVFDNTVSVRQMNVRPEAEEMDSVGGEIQRVLTGTAHISASEALKQLESRRSDLKGRARPAHPREYDKIGDDLRKLAEQLADARRSREQIRNLEDELTDLETRVGRDSERLEVLAALLERHKTWSDLKKREAEADRLHAGVFAALKKLKDTLADLKFAQKELEGYANLVGKDEEIAAHLSKIDGRRGELEGRLAQFEGAGAETRAAGPAIFLISAFVLALAGLAAGFMFDRKAFLLLAPAAILAFKYIQMRVSPNWRSEHIVKLTKSARGELEQVNAEEKSILSYIGCQDSAKAWAKIKAYRGLAARAHELEVALSALLNGRKLEDWKAQEADLDRELSGIRRELEDNFSGYSPTTEEAESWRSEYAALQNSLPTAQARLHEVRGSLEAERRNARDLAALEGEIEFLHQRKSELEFTYKAYDEAIAALTAVAQMVSEEYLPALCERATRHMKQVTSSRYTSVLVKPGWDISVDCADKTAVEPDALSIGTLDQLYLALRIASAELLATGRKLPIILDDPFANFDRSRLDNVLDLLAVLAAENQIVLFTHDSYVLDRVRDLESSGRTACLVHELPDRQKARRKRGKTR